METKRAECTATGHSDEELLRRVLNYINPTRGGKVARWSRVGDMFGLGSFSASQLCRRFGLDPFEKI